MHKSADADVASHIGTVVYQEDILRNPHNEKDS